MVRVDNKQDSDRPHYYSQFWIDVALGKPSAPVVAPAAETDEDEDEDMAFAAPRPEARPEARPKPSKPAEKKPDAGRPTLTSLADLANIDMLMKNSAEMDDTETPDITESIRAGLPPSVPGLDYDVETDAPADSEEGALASQDQDFLDYDEEEDEEDDDWGGSRRKKSGKPQKRREHRDF